jgi:hypothetical protein
LILLENSRFSQFLRHQPRDITPNTSTLFLLVPNFDAVILIFPYVQ